MTADHLELAFALHARRPCGVTWSWAGSRVRFQPVPHFIPANAVEFAPTAAGGSPSVPIAVRARSWSRSPRDTDLLMLEATLPSPAADARAPTPFEAGEHAARAGAKRLVLTHFTADLGAERVVAEAGARSPGRSTPPTKVRSTTSVVKGRGRGRSPWCDHCHRRHGWCAPALAPAVSPYKVEHLASEPAAGDIAVEGLCWPARAGTSG